MKKSFLFLLLVFFVLPSVIAQGDQLNVIVIGAHPDDCDLDAGGVAIEYVKMGHRVKFVSMTNGDAGHQSMGGGALAKRRMAEAKEAGRRFGVEYTVVDNGVHESRKFVFNDVFGYSAHTSGIIKKYHNCERFRVSIAVT